MRKRTAPAAPSRSCGSPTRAERGVVDIETGLRGYLLTRDADFLEPYENGRRDYGSRLVALDGLTRDPASAAGSPSCAPRSTPTSPTTPSRCALRAYDLRGAALVGLDRRGQAAARRAARALHRVPPGRAARSPTTAASAPQARRPARSCWPRPASAARSCCSCCSPSTCSGPCCGPCAASPSPPAGSPTAAATRACPRPAAARSRSSARPSTRWPTRSARASRSCDWPATASTASSSTRPRSSRSRTCTAATCSSAAPGSRRSAARRTRCSAAPTPS